MSTTTASSPATASSSSAVRSANAARADLAQRGLLGDLRGQRAVEADQADRPRRAARTGGGRRDGAMSPPGVERRRPAAAKRATSWRASATSTPPVARDRRRSAPRAGERCREASASPNVPSEPGQAVRRPRRRLRRRPRRRRPEAGLPTNDADVADQLDDVVAVVRPQRGQRRLASPPASLAGGLAHGDHPNSSAIWLASFIGSKGLAISPATSISAKRVRSAACTLAVRKMTGVDADGVVGTQRGRASPARPCPASSRRAGSPRAAIPAPAPAPRRPTRRSPPPSRRRARGSSSPPRGSRRRRR